MHSNNVLVCGFVCAGVCCGKQRNGRMNEPGSQCGFICVLFVLYSSVLFCVFYYGKYMMQERSVVPRYSLFIRVVTAVVVVWVSSSSLVQTAVCLLEYARRAIV